MTLTRNSELAIEELDGDRHNRAEFSCGVPALDQYLRRQASQDARNSIASVYVATPDGKTIAGFYTLSQFSIAPDMLPEEIRKKLPKYSELPASLLGRLATASAFRGVGVGERLLVSAIRRYCATSRQIASTVLLVDAKDENAASFYARFGFQRIDDMPDRMFLTLKTALRV